MKSKVFVIFFIVLFQHIMVSQKYDSITIDARKVLASKRYNDSISSYLLMGYLKGNTIRRITERIELHKKNNTLEYYTVEIQIIYTFHHGKLAGVEQTVTDKPGPRDKDSLLSSLIPSENNYNSFIISGDKIFKYSKEDDSLLRNNEVFINRKQ